MVNIVFKVDLFLNKQLSTGRYFLLRVLGTTEGKTIPLQVTFSEKRSWGCVANTGGGCPEDLKEGK